MSGLADSELIVEALKSRARVCGIYDEQGQLKFVIGWLSYSMARVAAGSAETQEELTLELIKEGKKICS